MSFEPGEVLLVPFPFTDLSSEKKRPAVVVSSAAYNVARTDIVVMAVTSQVRTPLGRGEVMLHQWRDAGLVKPSVVKPSFATLHQGLALRRLGGLSTTDLQAVIEALSRLLG